MTCLLLICAPALAQTTNREPQAGTEQKQSDKIRNADLIEAERRTFAISSLTSLANEARSYDDLTLRTRVLARVADALWEVDAVTARSLFRRAREAAETGDAQETNPKAKDSPPAMVLALRSAVAICGWKFSAWPENATGLLVKSFWLN